MFFKQGLTAIAVSILAIALQVGGLWQPLENISYTWLFRLRQQTPLRHHWDSQLVVIAIDEDTLKKYGRLSDWDRRNYIKLLRNLAPLNPTAIAFDIIFSEPTTADQNLAEEFNLTGNIILAVATDRQQKQIELVPALAENSQWGHVAIRSDNDGIPRQASLYIGNFPAFALSAFQIHHQSLEQNLASPPTVKVFPSPQPVPNLQEQKVWINWPAPAQELPTYSFQAVLNGQLPSSLNDKIILIGATATGLDPLRTPFEQNPPTSGVYFQAALLNNLLQNNFLRVLSTGEKILLLSAIAFLSLLILNRNSWQNRLLWLGFLLLSWPAIALLSFGISNIWLPVAAPLGTILLTATGLQWREQYEKQQLMRLFAQHLSPAMALDVWQRRQEIFSSGQLEVRELTVTVVFVDIRGFTGISEQLSPKQLLTWLNRYFDAMSLCIEEQNGVIDKYIGDAIMAVFGVPLPKSQPSDIQQDALAAIATSLNLVKRLQILNQELIAENQPTIEIGIGIHTGSVVAGSVGGRRRLNYSVLGDTVNVASRLESFNKEITIPRPYPILLSDQTLNYIQDQYATRAIGEVFLPGKVISTPVYTILDKV